MWPGIDRLRLRTNRVAQFGGTMSCDQGLKACEHCRHQRGVRRLIGLGHGRERQLRSVTEGELGDEPFNVGAASSTPPAIAPLMSESSSPSKPEVPAGRHPTRLFQKSRRQHSSSSSSSAITLSERILVVVSSRPPQSGSPPRIPRRRPLVPPGFAKAVSGACRPARVDWSGRRRARAV